MHASNRAGATLLLTAYLLYLLTYLLTAWRPRLSRADLLLHSTAPGATLLPARALTRQRPRLGLHGGAQGQGPRGE